jgi:hypothetical protein
MNNDSITSSLPIINLMLRSGPCYDFVMDGHQAKKTIWLVPHVIKYRDESEVITWRCNWGNVCESRCLYAMTKDKNWQPMNSQPVAAKV